MNGRPSSPRSLALLGRQPVVRALAAAARGVEAHLVGGVLRDRLLGVASRDFDAVVGGRGREIAARVAADLGSTLVLLGGRAFAAYRVVGRIGGPSGGDDFVLDLWDRDQVPLERDLARRDFTVNAFALGVEDLELVDPFGGLDDLGRRVLRATTPASFRDDPLRVLRLPRLLAQLPGFAADPATLELARAEAAGLVTVAAERVREELALTFKSEDASRALALLAALEVYPGLWRGSPPTGTVAGAAAGRVVRELEWMPEALRLLRRRAPDAADAADLLAARLAATFAGLPGVAEGETDPAAAAGRFHAAGYLTARLAARVGRLVAWRRPPAGERPRRRFLHALGELWPTAAVYLGAVAAARGELDGWRRTLAELMALAEADGGAIFDPPRLLGGDEVQALLGIGPGPGVGEALAAVRTAQVEGRVRSREEAVALLTGTSPSSRRRPASD